MTAIAISRIGVCAPGLPDWPTARAVLRNAELFRPTPMASLVAVSLPSTERRRANALTHLALHVAAEAVSGLPADEVVRLPAVFCSPDGDGIVLAQMLSALAQPSVALSPTLFHNSVYNAPAGYWSIARRCEAAATTVCAGEGSFAAGLIESMTQVCATGTPLLYVVFGATFPESLRAFGLDHPPFACALLLGPDDRAGARLDGSMGSLAAAGPDRSRLARCGTVDGFAISPERKEGAEPPPVCEFFERNAAAAALPLLAAVARDERVEVSLPYLDGAYLHVAYAP